MIARSTLHFFIYCLFSILALTISAQQGYEVPNIDQLDVIKIDLDKGTISSAFPFDKKFKLEITSKKYELSKKLAILPFKYKDKKREAIEVLKCDTMSFNSNVTPIAVASAYVNKLRNVPIKLRKHVKYSNSPIPIISYNKTTLSDYKKIRSETKSVLIKLPYNKKKLKGLGDASIIRLYSSKRRFRKKLESIKVEHGNGSFDVSRHNIIYPIQGKIEHISVTLEKSDDSTYRCVVPSLQPNTLYDLVFKKYPKENEIKNYYEVISLSSNNPNLAHLKYNQNIKTLESNQNRHIPYKSIEQDFSEFLLKKHPLYYRNKSLYITEVIQLMVGEMNRDITYFFPWNHATIRTTGKIFQDKKYNLSNFSRITSDFLKPIGEQLQLYTGQKRFGTEKVPEINNYQKRKEILADNIKDLDTLITELNKIIVSNNSVPAVALKNRVVEARSFANSVFKELKGANDFMVNNMKSEISFYEPVSSTTSHPNLKTRNAQVIVPDFGFLVSRQVNSQGEVVVLPRPSIGFNIHIGGIDKNIPLKYLENKNLLRHNFSLAMGITVGKISEDGYTDLFNGISPYLGINYRIDKQIRLGAGALFVNDTDINPIAEETIFDPGIYIMVSFDFENLFSQLGKVATKIIN